MAKVHAATFQRVSRRMRPLPNQDDLTLAEPCDLDPNQITHWKSQLQEGAAGVLGEVRAEQAAPVDLKALHAKIGELTLESDPLEWALTKAGFQSVNQ